MPFIPHTKKDSDAMLQAIGVETIDELFDEIPSNLKIKALEGIPEGLIESELNKLFADRAKNMTSLACYAGAGAYEHHIPAAVWEIASRGEFLTCYTPYQAEASQGSLQVIFEYQTMMASLMGLAVSNASLYDGATALVEAILMILRLTRSKSPTSIWIPMALHPHYRQVIATFLKPMGARLIEIPFDEEGKISERTLEALWQKEASITALIIAQPNFLGCLEEVDLLTNWAHAKGAKVIGVVNPLAMGLLKPPGQWGNNGAELACGEGQPLGVPLAGGGPYFGFLCCHEEQVRQLPGRLVGKTVDKAGNPGYVLTLQTREQHIRREKATSNICTNQGLLVVAATLYMSLVGPVGLKKVAARCHQLAHYFKEALKDIPEVKVLFSHFFHEVVLVLPFSAEKIFKEMEKTGYLAGYLLENHYPSLTNTLLVCLTETKSEEDIRHYVATLKKVINGNI